jgi:hypothetical protein
MRLRGTIRKKTSTDASMDVDVELPKARHYSSPCRNLKQKRCLLTDSTSLL